MIDIDVPPLASSAWSSAHRGLETFVPIASHRRDASLTLFNVSRLPILPGENRVTHVSPVALLIECDGSDRSGITPACLNTSIVLGSSGVVGNPIGAMIWMPSATLRASRQKL